MQNALMQPYIDPEQKQLDMAGSLSRGFTLANQASNFRQNNRVEGGRIATENALSQAGPQIMSGDYAGAGQTAGNALMQGGYATDAINVMKAVDQMGVEQQKKMKVLNDEVSPIFFAASEKWNTLVEKYKGDETAATTEMQKYWPQYYNAAKKKTEALGGKVDGLNPDFVPAEVLGLVDVSHQLQSKLYRIYETKAETAAKKSKGGGISQAKEIQMYDDLRRKYPKVATAKIEKAVAALKSGNPREVEKAMADFGASSEDIKMLTGSIEIPSPSGKKVVERRKTKDGRTLVKYEDGTIGQE